MCIRDSVMTIAGRCLCGAIRWESSAPLVVTRVCWCRECQYIGAGGGTVNACFRTATFTVTGQTSDYASVADSGNRMHRRFCPSCGTPLFSEAEVRPHLLSLIHISEPTRLLSISYAVFCLK